MTPAALAPNGARRAASELSRTPNPFSEMGSTATILASGQANSQAPNGMSTPAAWPSSADSQTKSVWIDSDSARAASTVPGRWPRLANASADRSASDRAGSDGNRAQRMRTSRGTA